MLLYFLFFQDSSQNSSAFSKLERTRNRTFANTCLVPKHFEPYLSSDIHISWESKFLTLFYSTFFAHHLLSVTTFYFHITRFLWKSKFEFTSFRQNFFSRQYFHFISRGFWAKNKFQCTYFAPHFSEKITTSSVCVLATPCWEHQALNPG